MWRSGGPLREQARSHRAMHFKCGSEPAREGARQAPHHLTPGLTRNALAFASITKYITTVINNGRMK